MDNEELRNILLVCANKLNDESVEVDFTTESHICKIGDIILNGASSEETYRSTHDKQIYKKFMEIK
jgi:hypothetical protein